MACKVLDLTDQHAWNIVNDRRAWELEKGISSNYNSTARWGSENCIKVAILNRYLEKHL